jgi:catechol 2,3-dioxygenase-like lactoylglutathione lyase family enzyme/transposase
MNTKRKTYPSDVSDDEWGFVVPCLTLMRLNAPQRDHDLRAVFTALPDAKHGFVLLPRRWVVERGCPLGSIAWMSRFRRLVRDYERLPETLAGLHLVAITSLMLQQAFPLPDSSSQALELGTFPGVENVALAPSQVQQWPRRAARRRRRTTMTIQRMDNVLIVVDDLEAAKAFFVELGMQLEGETTVEGPSVDRLIGLPNVRATLALMRTPDGHGRIELDKFHTPEAIRTGPENLPVNALGIRRIMFAVDDFDDVVARLLAHGAELVGEVVQYEDSYRLCYVRGPEGIIVGLAEQRG